MHTLMEAIGYHFKDASLLHTALTHSSYANEHKTDSYERLEFLGDSVLSFIVSTQLYGSKTGFPEGEMSKLRAAIVCERSLEECARQLHIGDYLILSKGEELTGGRSRASILADVFESILAAIYLDGGIEQAERFVMSQLGEAITMAQKGTALFKDYKTALQELVQRHEKHVAYRHVSESGPDHNKTFVVEVICEGKILASGSGRSKKDAEQNAARRAIAVMQNE